jgi:hypothetical protein
MNISLFHMFMMFMTFILDGSPIQSKIRLVPNKVFKEQVPALAGWP